MDDIIDLCCSDHSISDDDDDDPLLSFRPFTAKASSSITSLTKKRKVEESEAVRKESVKQNRVVVNLDAESVSTRKDDSSSSSSIPATNEDMTMTMSQNAKERLDDTVTERLSSSNADNEIIEIDSSSEEECEDDEQSYSSQEDMDNLEIIDNKRKMTVQNPYAKKFTCKAAAIVSPPLKAPSNKPSNMMHQRTPCKPIVNPYLKTSNVGGRQTSFSTSSLSRPIAIAKRRVGKNVMYLLRDGNSGMEKWKLVKALNEEEKAACQRYRNKQKSVEKSNENKAKFIVHHAELGNINRVDEIMQEIHLGNIEHYLAAHINSAKIREDQDISDWGKVKRSMYFYEHTPLISAVLRTDIKVVLSLLYTGLCDPTLESCMNCFIDDRYTMHEDDVTTALKAAQNQSKRPFDSVEKRNDAKKIEALILEALKMWPAAKDKSAESACSEGSRKYMNRMHGVSNSSTQQQQTMQLRANLENILKM